MNCTNEKEDASEEKSDIKSFNNSAALETLEITMRQLQELEDNFIKLAVRSLMLEVDLATQFGPDLAMTIEQVDKSCLSCSQTVVSSSLSTWLSNNDSHSQAQQGLDSMEVTSNK